MSLNTADQTATISFNADHKVGSAYTMITTEQELVVKTYAKPEVKKSIAGQRYFRLQIQDSQKALTPFLTHQNCLSFDQSYYTRTIGQIEIQKKLESKRGALHSYYSLFSGAGFGSIQAFWSALGWRSSDLQIWFTTGLRKSIKKQPLKKALEVSIAVLFGSDDDRRTPKKIEKELRKAFSIEGRDLTVRECKSDVFIPIQDLSGKTIVINKENYPNMPIYVAIGASIFDPVFFKTEPHLSNLGVLNGDVVKNNDWLIKKNNQNIAIDSVGSPVRCFNRGSSKIRKKDLALKISDQKHETDLIMSKSIASTRYECYPIDEFFQFAVTDSAVQTALSSADKVEIQ